MHRLLGGALAQLEHRCDDLMTAVAASTDARMECQRERVTETVETVKRVIKNSHSKLAEIDPEPRGRDNVAWMAMVGQLSERLHVVERSVAPVLLRFDERDKQITLIAERLLRDAGWTRPTPIVTAFSTHYFHTDPAYQVIAAPAGEERRLLRLPDLCHEFGHCLCYDEGDKLASDPLLRLVSDVTKSRADACKRRQDYSTAERYDETCQNWLNPWLEEFCSDIVATYLTGESYALQHFSLTVVLNRDDPHKQTPTHPSDAARWVVIEKTLRQLQLDEAAADLHRRWEGLLTIRESGPRVKTFDHWYPHELIDATVDNTIAVCRQLGLRPFDPKADPEDNLPRLVDEAWRHFLEQPRDYNAWEAERIAALVATF
jgi:hypothetical protein